jgi:hypothetical protein
MTPCQAVEMSQWCKAHDRPMIECVDNLHMIIQRYRESWPKAFPLPGGDEV